MADELSYSNENLEHDQNLESNEKNKIFTTDTSRKKSPVWIQKDPKTLRTLESDRPAYEYRIYSRFIFPRCQIATRSFPIGGRRNRTVEFRRASIADVISSISSGNEAQEEHSRECEELTKTIRTNGSENEIQEGLIA